MPSAKILEEKKVKVEELSQKMKDSALVILTDYRGINVEDVTKIRSDLRKVNAEYTVAKNTLLKFAAKNNNVEELEQYLEGPTSVVFSKDDYVTPAKIIYDYGKNKEYFKIKAGIMDGKVVSGEEIAKLAKLPSKEMLYTQLATVLLANIRNLAVVLDQTRQSKEEAEA